MLRSIDGPAGITPQLCKTKSQLFICCSSYPLGELPGRSVSALPPHDKYSLALSGLAPARSSFQPRKASTETEIYSKFVPMLKPDDYVLTFPRRRAAWADT